MRHLDETKTWGIEIEMISPVSMSEVARSLQAEGIRVDSTYTYTHEVMSGWKLVPDDSVHGSGQSMELVSPPLAGSLGMVELKKVCQVLANLGCTVNSTCGLHIHHDALECGLETVVNLHELYKRFESEIDKMMPRSRRGDAGNYCHSLQGMNSEQYAISPSFQGRYFKLNFVSFEKYGTVEFRHHSGTVEFEKISNWVEITQALIRAAEFDQTGKPFQAILLQYAGSECLSYYLNRVNHFGGRLAVAA